MVMGVIVTMFKYIEKTKYLGVLCIAIGYIYSSPISADALGGGSVLRFAPTDKFKDHINRSFAVDGFLAWKPTSSKFTIGGYLQYAPYHSVNNTDRLVVGVNTNVETKSSLTNIGLLFQIIPFEGIIQPYLEGMLGFAIVKTDSTAKSELLTSDDSDEIAKSNNSQDTSFISGYGLGILIKLYEGNASKLTRTKTNVSTAWYLDLKYRRYFSNAKTSFIVPTSIKVEEDEHNHKQLLFDTTKERVTYETFQVGVAIEF